MFPQRTIAKVKQQAYRWYVVWCLVRDISRKVRLMALVLVGDGSLQAQLWLLGNICNVSATARLGACRCSTGVAIGRERCVVALVTVKDVVVVDATAYIEIVPVVV